jgi:hypothetical protein
MVAPGFPQNQEVRRWLNGIKPAWTMLEFSCYNALHQEPSTSNQAIRLEPNLTARDHARRSRSQTACRRIEIREGVSSVQRPCDL